MSFDPFASIYDETRVFDLASFNAALDYIVGRFPPDKFPSLFEPGIGTGRISIPLAEKGYRVTGADISVEMLKILADKLKARHPPLPVTFIKHDITHLPFPDASFNIAVAVHIFHLVAGWKKAVSEVFRILKPDAPLIIMFTGSGREVPTVKDRYKTICAEFGHPVRPLGINTDAALPDYVSGLGYHVEQIRDRWKWQSRVCIDKALAEIKAKYYSHQKLVPDDVHAKAVEKLELELRQQYGNLAVEIDIPTRIDMILVLPR